MSPDQAGKPPSETELHYRRLVQEQAKSGLPQYVFAARKGIAATTFSWWKSEIAHRDTLRARRNGTHARPRLLPVEIVASAMDRHEPKTPDRWRPEFVVRLRSGREVRVEHGFDVEELKRLVEALEAC